MYLQHGILVQGGPRARKIALKILSVHMQVQETHVASQNCTRIRYTEGVPTGATQEKKTPQDSFP